MKLNHKVFTFRYCFLFTVNDCTPLQSPEGGSVEVNGYVSSSVARYQCKENFRVIPSDSENRTCTINNWNGVDPKCCKFTFGIAFYSMYYMYCKKYSR